MSKQSITEVELPKTTSVLIQGEPGKGKTVASCRFPKPLIIDADNNVAAATRYLTEIDEIGKQPIYVENPHYRELVIKKEGEKEIIKREAVSSYQKWPRFIEILREAIVDDDIETIVWDSLTSVKDFLIDFILSEDPLAGKNTVAGIPVMQIQHWNPFYTLMLKAIFAAKSSGKNFVCISHNRWEKDDFDGAFHLFPNIPGQLKDQIAGMFEEYWQAESRVVGDGKVKYFMRMRPLGKVKAKTTTSLPNEFTFNYDEFFKQLVLDHKSKPEQKPEQNTQTQNK
jgi:hypothetical protein